MQEEELMSLQLTKEGGRAHVAGLVVMVWLGKVAL